MGLRIRGCAASKSNRWLARFVQLNVMRMRLGKVVQARFVAISLVAKHHLRFL